MGKIKRGILIAGAVVLALATSGCYDREGVYRPYYPYPDYAPVPVYAPGYNRSYQDMRPGSYGHHPDARPAPRHHQDIRPMSGPRSGPRSGNRTHSSSRGDRR